MARFEQKVDAADKSAKIFLRVLQTHKFHSGRGANKNSHFFKMATGGAIVFSYIENKLAIISGTHGRIFMQIFL